jgi:hypothetical protein
MFANVGLGNCQTSVKDEASCTPRIISQDVLDLRSFSF